ncbi:hypothetical protein GW796_05715 [archaeon]|nr:hypothetical protein [archaeon]NCQ51381.1 hypothetical protein [archaeon]NCT58793.1 hypothetical protein [archaeon]
MKIIAIDLSLRSTGISYVVKNTLIDFSVIKNKTAKDEDLILDNCNKIINWIKEKNENPDFIRIEGLSFNSISGAKDIITGQFWYLRCKIVQEFPNSKLEIIPVLTWRNPLFNKYERKELAEAKKRLKLLKKSSQGEKGNNRKEILLFNKNLELDASIKEKTWLKLNKEIQNKIIDYITYNKYNIETKYDITDSIFIGLF